MPTKIRVLEELKLDELRAAADEFELEVVDRRVRGDLLESLRRSKRARLAKILKSSLSRTRLIEVCRTLGIEADGRNIDDFISALDPGGLNARPKKKRALPSKNQDSETVSTVEELMSEHVQLVDTTTTWPLKARLAFGAQEFNADIYIRKIGPSSRGNPLERRLQNPSKKNPILRPESGYLLLMGLWLEQGEERAVLAAFDGFRRLGRTTRFSLFMPVALLERAADTGFASHQNSSGETIYAFRPENLDRYLDVLGEEPIWDSPAGLTSAADDAPVTRSTASTPLASVDADQIYIRPRVGMYAAFARLNYKPWFALAEFVDNSIQSFLNTRSGTESSGPLNVDISIDQDEIEITDRAGGIALADFPRAFSPAAPPDDATGLSEFGLGMKAAACWFSKRWTVRTSAVGDNSERTVIFDVPVIAREGLENLPIEKRAAREDDHFTVVSLRSLRVRPRGRTLTKIKEHLASIYRVLMADGLLTLRVTTGTKTEVLDYQTPPLLSAPYYRTPRGAEQTWRRELTLELEDGRKVSGWAGILAKGSFVHAGFSIFRRRRLVEGSAGETYKPKAIFGNPNSYASQRVIGELHVEGFDVTHTKDGIQWGGREDEVVEGLRAQINAPELPLLDQANGYRARKSAENLKPGFGVSAVDTTAEVLAQPKASDALRARSSEEPSEDPAEELPPRPTDILVQRKWRTHVPERSRPLDVELELVRTPGAAWYALHSVRSATSDQVTLRINLHHPFSDRYINEDESSLRALVPLVSSLALAEIMARDAGVAGAGEIRRNTNELLRRVLSDDVNQESE